MIDLRITERTAARARRDRFYVGRPCHEGHDGTRYTKSATCVQCQRESEKRHRLRKAA